MRTSLALFVSISILIALNSPTLASDDWRTLVNDQVKRSRIAMRADTVDVLTISLMLEKDGDEKSRDSSLTRIYYDGDDQVIESFGDDGELAETKREHHPVGHVSKASLMAMFDVENVAEFTLTEQGYDDSGRLIVDFEAVHPADSLFAGTAYIDTAAWFPVRMEMAPSELPDKVKEMDMVARFAPDEDGVFRPHLMVTNGRAKWLLMNFYFSTETQYEW
jgi:hypothetical protein